jgi:RNA recognition motif-containing protein
LKELDNKDMDAETFKKTIGLTRKDTVYVSNLPFSCKEEDLKTEFRNCGEILNVRMPEDP